MEIKINNKTGSAKICFSWRERWLLFRTGFLKMEKESIKHFINSMFHVLIQLNHSLPEDVRNKVTDPAKDKISVE